VTTQQTLSRAQARRIALAAQGFAEKRPRGRPSRRHVLGVLDRIGLFQIDSVNVLVRSHYLPAFARLGDYPAELIDRLAYGRKRELFEYWGHEASLLPLALQPYLRWRMADAEQGHGTYGSLQRFRKENRALVDAVEREIRERGPLGAGEIESGSKSRAGWWEWGESKMALEWLFWAGRITTAGRRNFERLYDLPERVLPADTLALPTPPRAEAIRHLLRLSAAAMGIGTMAELRDYLRLPVEGLKTRIAELVEDGTLEPVQLEGSRLQHYKHRDARLPRRVQGANLLSPFDSLVWERDRTERLFGFFYRLEIYTPAPKRKHGYYVLPFRLDEDLPARFCLKSERATGTLAVNSAHLEQGRDAEAVAAAAAPELRRMAQWLGLESVRVGRRGDLASPLRRALRA